MKEPICENSDTYNVLHGYDVDEELDTKGPGPHEGCFCDACFYGTRAAWLAGRASLQPERDQAVFLLRQVFGYLHLGWATDGTWPNDTEAFIRGIGEWPAGNTRLM